MNKRAGVALSVVVLGAMIISWPAQAQRRFAGASAPAFHGRPGFPMRPGPRPHFVLRGQGRFFRRSAFGLFPYYYPYLDSESYSEPAVVETPAPQQVFVQTTEAHAPKPAILPDPLLLEAQGDHWVRVTSSGTEFVQSGVAPSSGTPSETRRVNEAISQPAALPPTVLVFRDGHQEEVKKYSIIGGVLYTGADYWKTGSWTRKVSIATLDVPATLKANQAHGVNFSLPSGPGEVIIEP